MRHRNKLRPDTPKGLCDLIRLYLLDREDEMKEALAAADAVEFLKADVKNLRGLIRTSKSNAALLDRIEQLERRLDSIDRWAARLGRKKGQNDD